MKDWFKHEFGYANIDSENIYFTHTGNWSEITDLKEKGIHKKNEWRKGRMQLFILICCLLSAFLFYKNLISGKVSLLLLAGLPTGGYFVYNYLRTELGPKYKLPIQKLLDIVFDQKNTTITFINGKNENDSEILKNVDQKGLDLLKKLIANKS